ncbi:MAG: hotdog fold domain-containing protein [Gammaproteobacteria bacterium]
MPTETTPSLVRLYERCARFPLGKTLFSRMVSFRAPYFGSIRPRITQLSASRSEVLVRKRRRVTNHIGTVHALAMGNACEMAAGTLTEAATPRTARWIPRGMTIEYRAKATTDVRAIAWLDEPIRNDAAYDVIVPVDVLDRNDQVVVHAKISMYISPKPPKTASKT